jgi:hypothetical protein
VFPAPAPPRLTYRETGAGRRRLLGRSEAVLQPAHQSLAVVEPELPPEASRLYPWRRRPGGVAMMVAGLGGAHAPVLDLLAAGPA